MSQNRFKIHLLIILISIITGGGAAFAWSNHTSSKSSVPADFLETKTDVNKPFPNLGITKYSGQGHLVDYISDKKVLLIVFSANCNACKNELEHLKAANMLRGTGIEIVIAGINEENSLKEVLNEYDVQVPVFDDRTSKIRDAFDLKVTPVNFLIDRGKIDRTWNGASSGNDDLIKKLGLTR